MNRPPDWHRYAWADDDEDLLASCLGVVTGPLTETDVIAVHHLDPRSCVQLSVAGYEERDPLGEQSQGAQVWSEGEAVVVRELRGGNGLIEPVVAALSRGGRYVAYAWNDDGDELFVYAVDGAVIRRFDPVDYDPEGAVEEEAGLPWPAGDALGADAVFTSASAVLTLMERLTGVRFDDREALYEQPRPFYRRLPSS